MSSMVRGSGVGSARKQRGLRRLRGELYRCLTGRADELFELTEALLCTKAR